MGLFDKIKKAFIKEKEEQSVVEEQSIVAEQETVAEQADAATLVTEVTPSAEDKAMDEELSITEEVSVILEENKLDETKKMIETPTEPEEVEVVTEIEATPPIVEEIKVPIVEPNPQSTQNKYDKGLEKTRKTFKERMNELFANFRAVDEDFFEEVEETLIGADVGFETSMKIAEDLRQEVKLKNLKKPAAVQNAIIEKMVDLYEAQGINENHTLNIQPNQLTVMLFVGVNGVGKTTSIGKLANQYRLAGKKVLLAAADTFRAGAIDQLVVWGERAQVEVVRGKAGGDPAAVVFDALEKAKEQQADILLVDTAGRLQNKVNLMNELDKIKRVIQREVPDAPHEVLLVVDATTGQNAMIQAKQFKETTDVTGLVLTKLDGTAKGGIVIAIRNELHLPVKLVGLGEGINDLEVFNPNDFVMGLFKGLLEEE
ncbi:signal recognition particle-docking protein FtsY [Enterococcus lemanii]|uniref:Signal recognition particle receptor FtsY n=1 Tax=Enterococcus lemanii TaxID=1159752 RepID=A0ABV9MWI2_9ENTE|nr:fused signal recognition particle receptor [Enterococcus lemanii]